MEENVFEAETLKSLCIKAGIPGMTEVKNGETYTCYIEVWKPFSIVSWNMAIVANDIDFKIS